MRVTERTIYRGPHLHSRTPMVRFMLDLGELEEFPTSRLEGFTDALLDVLPSLHGHGCSRHRPGGFVERLQEGTWIGHVVEHIALELQALVGSEVARGKTRSVRGRPGVYNVMYAYRDERVGVTAGRMALELVSSLLSEAHAGVEGLSVLAPAVPSDPADGRIPGMAALQRMARRAALGPTTSSIVEEAQRRGIPVQRLDEYSLVRLGNGHRQKLLRASITGVTSHIAVESAGDKNLTKSLLAEAGVAVPKGVVVRTADEAVAAAKRLPGPVVTKPLDGNHGRGVTVGLVDEESVRRGFDAAIQHSRRVIVEQQFSGRDYRMLVVGGKVVAVAERIPAHVVGDGNRSITALIEELNADPRRGIGHEKVMTQVRMDAALEALLTSRGFRMEHVPARGQVVELRDTANLSTGGEAVDRTDEIHPENRVMAERAARIIGLDIAGLDVLSPDLSRPISETGGGIIEVNAAPGFRMHLQPSSGEPRDVASPVVDMLYPRGARSRIPIIAVTGTNGKSTTVRMIGHILQEQGLNVGLTSTSGIYVGGNLVKAADASGPKSARTVLGDPTVEAAVLETARGGMLREGLAYDAADVGIVLNITADHLGLKGIDTLEDLAALKSIVVRNVKRRGTSILNADDRYTLRMARHARGTIAYFTMSARADFTPELVQHLEAGGVVAGLEAGERGGTIVLHVGSQSVAVVEAAEIPATLGGAAGFNIQNALAAVLATYFQGVSPSVIAASLRSFVGDFEQNPGRLNLTRAPGFSVIVDYAHNPAALQALGEVIERLRPDHRRVIGVVSVPGDRRDEDIREMGQIAASIFDELVFRERPDGRGRASGGVISLLTDGAIAAGLEGERVRRILDEREAVHAALSLAGPDDLVVMMPTDVDGTWAQVQEFRLPDSFGAHDEAPADSQPAIPQELARG